MSGSRWTPGPWRVEDHRRKHYALISGSTDGAWKEFARVVVRMGGDDDDSREGLANARLIAAAPTLYEELRAIGDVLGAAEWGTPEHGADLFYETIRKHHARIRAALALAEPARAERQTGPQENP